MSFKEFEPYASAGTFGRHRFSEPACPGLPKLSHYKQSKDAGGSNWRNMKKELLGELDPST